MPLLAVAGNALDPILRLFAEEAEVGFQLNLFWIIAQAGSFLLFFVILYFAAFKRIGGVLEERRSKIEQGLRDADDARKEREQAASERLQVLTQARGEAEEILTRAQKVADDSRQRDIAETRAQLEQMKTQATADIAAEKDRALADVRSQVAELALAAASRVVGETMTSEREKRLVNEFLTEVGKK